MKMDSRLFVTVFAAVWLAVTPAMAQDADLRGLSEQLLRLGNDIKDIQLYIYRGFLLRCSRLSGLRSRRPWPRMPICGV